VIGVDTHRDEHVLAVLAAPAGVVVAGRAVPTNACGYREMLRFAERYARGVHKSDLAANRADPADDRVCAPHGLEQ